MAITLLPNQYAYSGRGNLDGKMNAVEDLDELNASIPRNQRAIGMTVPVLNQDGDNIPYDYWLVGGTRDTDWERKTASFPITGNDVEE